VTAGWFVATAGWLLGVRFLGSWWLNDINALFCCGKDSAVVIPEVKMSLN